MEINRHNSNLLWFDLQPNGEQEFITIYILLDDKITLIETGPACSHSNFNFSGSFRMIANNRSEMG